MTKPLPWQRRSWALGLTNGNLTKRTISGSTYTLGYDEENRLTSVSGAATAAFTFEEESQWIKGKVVSVAIS